MLKGVMKEKFIEINYPAIFTTKKNNEVVIRLLCFKKTFSGEDKLDAVIKAKKFLLEKIIEFKNKGKTAKSFMNFYPADNVNELSDYLKKGDEIEYISDEFYDDLNEFEEFTMFYINKLEAQKRTTKSKKELVSEQLKTIKEARKFAKENDVPVISVYENDKPNK